MQRIFKDERRGIAWFAAQSLRDGSLFPAGGVARGLCGPATLRHTLLTGWKNRSRHGYPIPLNRP